MRTPVLVCLVVMLTVAVPRAGQQAVPDTPAARQLARWLETFNAGDRVAWERFAREHYPAQPSPDPDIAFREQTGGFDLLRFEEAGVTRAVAVVKVRDSESTGARVIVEVQAEAPYPIVRVAVEPGVSLLSTAARLGESELPGAIRTELERRAAADRFAGAVLVTKGTRRLFAGAYGLADRDTGVP